MLFIFVAICLIFTGKLQITPPPATKKRKSECKDMTQTKFNIYFFYCWSSIGLQYNVSQCLCIPNLIPVSAVVIFAYFRCQEH